MVQSGVFIRFMSGGHGTVLKKLLDTLHYICSLETFKAREFNFLLNPFEKLQVCMIIVAGINHLC